MKHIIDMAYQEDQRDKPHAQCSCEHMMARGAKYCKHVEAVVNHLKNENHDSK